MVPTWRRDPASASKIRHARVAVTVLPEESDVLFGHVIERDRSVPGFEWVPRVVGEVWRTGDSIRSVDWGQQGQIAPRIVHLSTTDRYCIHVLFEPPAVVEHPTQESLFVGSDVARSILLISKASHSSTVFTSQVSR